MKFAVNYSKETEQLVKSNMIEIDMFKCPDFSDELIDRAQKIRPCYVHFGLNAGSGQMKQLNWSILKELKEKTQTPYVNVHAVAFAKHYPNVDILTNNKFQIEKMISETVQDIEKIANQVGAENVIVENVICRGPGENMMKAIIEPEIITEIVNQTGCGLLLDIAHARMTSMCLGLDVFEYILKLPVKHLKELHITGIQADGTGRLRDSMPMTTNDFELARWVISCINRGEFQKPWVAALEYGGVGPSFEWRTNKEVLAEQVPALYELIK